MNIDYSVEKIAEEIQPNGKYFPSELALYKTIYDDSSNVVAKIKLTPDDIRAGGTPEAAKDEYIETVRVILQEQLAEILSDNIKSSHSALGRIFGKNLLTCLEMLNAFNGYMEQPNGTLAPTD